MDLAKAQKIIRKNFKDYNVKSDLDEETLLMFLCVDLVREDMSQDTPAPAPSRSRKKDVAELPPRQQLSFGDDVSGS